MIEYLPLINMIWGIIIYPLYKVYQSQKEIIANQQEEIRLLKEQVKLIQRELETIHSLVFEIVDPVILKNHLKKPS